MGKEQITDREAICLLVLFTMGSALIMGTGGDAKNDIWISSIVGILMVSPMILIYSRLLSLYPGKDLFDITENLLGKVFGKVISVLYIWYAFHLGGLVIRNFGEFITTVSLPETPLFVPIFFLGLVCILSVKSGIEVMSRISVYFVILVAAILTIVNLLSIPELNVNYIKPVLGNGLSPVIKGGFVSFSFPFAEAVLGLSVFFSLKTKKSPYKVYFSGVLIAGGTIVILSIRNIMILGELNEALYFPSHEAVSRISIGSFLERIEVTVSLVFIASAFIKCSVCLFTACKGVSRVFNLHNYTSVVIQIGLLMIYFSYIVYKNIMDMNSWVYKIYPYYSFPFQVIIPIALWIIAEIKHRNKSATARKNYYKTS